VLQVCAEPSPGIDSSRGETNRNAHARGCRGDGRGEDRVVLGRGREVHHGRSLVDQGARVDVLEDERRLAGVHIVLQAGSGENLRAFGELRSGGDEFDLAA